MFYYYGGKTRRFKHYPKPAHPLIIEPFAGSAGYGVSHLMRDSRLALMLVEKDPEIAGLWRKILAAAPEQVERWHIPSVGERSSDRFVMLAAASNAIGTCSSIKVSERIQKEALRQRKKVAKALRLCQGRISLIEGCYTEAPDVEATWFIDPPYKVPENYSGKARLPAGMGYARGCNSESINYDLLARWARARRGQVLVCEYAAATWLPFQPLMQCSNTVGLVYEEGLWTQGTEA